MKNKKPDWLPLLSTSFLGVLNDNFLKKTVSFISIYWVAQGNENEIVAMAGGLFILPYLLLSPFAGYVAKIYLKKKVVTVSKFMELPIMSIASVGFIFNSIYFVMAAIFLMGVQSCMYSPAKYGLVRDVGGKENISYGIGAIEMLTFLGNLAGAVFAGIIADLTDNRTLFIIILFFIFSLTGWITSRRINVRESVPDKKENHNLNPLVFLFRSIRWSKSVDGLNFVVLGLSLFWLAAAMIEMNLITYCPNVLNMTYTQTGWLMAAVAVSIAAGSYVSGVLSDKKVELGLVPIGGVGFGLSISLIYFIMPGVALFAILIIVAAFFAGIYKIPLNSFLQERVKGRKLGDIIAYNNLSVFIFILFASVFIFIFENANTIFLIIAITIWLMTLSALFLLPESRKRLFKLMTKE